MPSRPASTDCAERRRPQLRMCNALWPPGGIAGRGWLVAATVLASLLLLTVDAQADVRSGTTGITTSDQQLAELAAEGRRPATAGPVSVLEAADPCWPWGRSEQPPPSTTNRPNPSRLAVPICLVEGASGIAPLLVHALDGARLAALPPWTALSQAEQVALSTDGGELPEAASGSDMHAALTTIGELHRRATEPPLVAPLRPEAAEQPPGFVPRVYRPPRS